MAKRVHSVSFTKAELNLEEGLLHEVTKEDVKTYRLMDILREFDGKVVALSIKEDQELEESPEE